MRRALPRQYRNAVESANRGTATSRTSAAVRVHPIRNKPSATRRHTSLSSGKRVSSPSKSSRRAEGSPKLRRLSTNCANTPRVGWSCPGCFELCDIMLNRRNLRIRSRPHRRPTRTRPESEFATPGDTTGQRRTIVRMIVRSATTFDPMCFDPRLRTPIAMTSRCPPA